MKWIAAAIVVGALIVAAAIVYVDRRSECREWQQNMLEAKRDIFTEPGGLTVVKLRPDGCPFP